MEETLTQNIVVTEAKSGPGINGIPEVDSNLSFKVEDFAADMAKLAGNTMQVTPATPDTPITTEAKPSAPTQPQGAVVTNEEKAEVVVPEKFKTNDGKVDEEKLNKSLTNVEEALHKYLEKEKELKRKMNEVKAKENAYINPQPANAPAPTIPVNSDFARKLEEDIAKEGAGVVLAKLFTAAQESVEERVKSDIEAIKAHNSENMTRRQVEAIGKVDPWVYTEEGLNTLSRILAEQPYLMQAEDPYKAAYLFYNGSRNLNRQLPAQVQTPNPTARPSAPVPTGQAAQVTVTPVINLNSKEAIDAHLKKLTPDEQSKFFEKAGFPSFKR